jgi:hypothetical protein
MDDNLRSTLLDQPGPFDTLEIWEEYLDEVRRLPPSVDSRAAMLHQARHMIASKLKDPAASKSESQLQPPTSCTIVTTGPTHCFPSPMCTVEPNKNGGSTRWRGQRAFAEGCH